MSIDIIFRILLIFSATFVVVGVVSYLFELHRYIDYLEKKLERYRDKEILEEREKQLL